MSLTCPNGHQSDADDFCDTCGAKIDPANQPATPAAAGGGDPGGAAGDPGAAASTPPDPAPDEQACPHCGVPNAAGSLFCEACGYDFTTGAMPRGAEPEAPVEPAAAQGSSTPESAAPAGPGAGGIPPAIEPGWVAEVWIDPEWYAGQEAEEAMPSAGLPVVVALSSRSALIGRVSSSRNIHPDIDCTSDSGVSRRHAQLTTDGTRWFVEDLGSANGTFVGGPAQALPEDPIPVGPKRELGDDDRIYVGAWTRIVVRRATDDELSSAG